MNSCINFVEDDLNKFYERFYGVVNLSSRRLSIYELSVLGKGLNFCPTPSKFDHGPIKESIDKFFRKCSLKLFFENPQNDQEFPDNHENPAFEHQDMKLASKFSPPMPSNLELIHYLICEEILSYNQVNSSRNLSNTQLSALSSLRNDEHIIIKKADKGSNIVIMDKTDYVKEVHRQLNDKNYYRKLTHDTSDLYRAQANMIITDMFANKEITEKTYKYLCDGGTKTSIFYILPKIHKRRENPPGRPIVSSINCPTEKISQLIDIVLRPYAQKGKSFVKDTPDLIKKLKDIKLDENDWLFSMDVQSLYTNIPHEEGLEVVRQAIKNRTSLPKNENILKMLSLVLKGNVFRFDNSFYLQTNGTAMGTRVAPTYAVIFMNAFEEKNIYPSKFPLKVWFRFIDDILGIFHGTEAELSDFFTYCNSLHNTIKFSYEYSRDRIVFLDIVIFRSERGRLETTLYTKPTDSKTYLDFSSCHPSHNKRSIPYSQFLHIRRNCSNWQDFAIHSVELVSYLSIRGYPMELITDSLMKVAKISQEEALSPIKGDKETNESLILVVEYNPSLPNLHQMLRKHWSLADRSSSTRSLNNSNIIISYTKPKNLKDILCSSDIRKKTPIRNILPRCRRLWKCTHCPRLNKNKKIVSTSTGRKYNVLTKVTCNSKNLIYCIECNECSLQYVGQTKNEIRLRINQHLSNIRTKVDTPIARHFAIHGLGNFKVFILQLMRDNDQNNRNLWENYWIARLHSVTPHGLNIKD